MTSAASAQAARGSHRRVDLARPTDRAALAVLAAAALLALLILSPSVGGARPGDPALIAGDARLARCGGSVADVEWAFVIPSARDAGRYIPALAEVAELDLARPALVIVYRGEFPGFAGPAESATPPAQTLRNVCVYVGPAGEGARNYFGDLSVAGLRATPEGPVLVSAPQT